LAIDRVKKVTLLTPRNRTHGLIEQLHHIGVFHVEDAAMRLKQQESRLGRANRVAAEAEEKIKQLDVILSTIHLHAKKKSGIVAQFAPVPIQVHEQEIDQALDLLVEPLYEECELIYAQHRELNRHIEEAERQIESLSFFAPLPVDFGRIGELRRVTVQLGRFTASAWRAFSADAAADELFAWQILTSQGKSRLVLVVYPAARRDEAAALLRRYEFQDVPLPRLRGRLEDRLLELQADCAAYRQTLAQHRERVLEIAQAERQIEILLGYWESERAKTQALNSSLSSKRITALAGYVRVKDLDKLKRMLEQEFPEVSIVSEDPALGDPVPVSMTIPRLLAPGKFLVSMFGLPSYFSFDPSPFLIFCFLTFFGMCFGDVVYGLVLMVVCALMARKYASHAGVHGFFVLFFYGGVATLIVGALTGGWAGDLPRYLGQGNDLQRLRESLAIIDPLRRPIVMLLVALGIGLASQLYAIVLRMYRELRWGRPLDALFDGGLWLLYLPGMLLLIAPTFIAGMPKALGRVGLWLFLAGAVGLVLTQGRREKGLFAKALTGLVSLYGILGSYGGVAFIGDMVSYSRLLALGMTTAVVAMSFNIFADMLGQVPGAGILLFAATALVGHIFNFAISILGAFVHSARLIFLEFFSRFYESGGVKFRPLGFSSDRIELIKD